MNGHNTGMSNRYHQLSQMEFDPLPHHPPSFRLAPEPSRRPILQNLSRSRLGKSQYLLQYQ